jgi:hypothetical protein
MLHATAPAVASRMNRVDRWCAVILTTRREQLTSCQHIGTGLDGGVGWAAASEGGMVVAVIVTKLARRPSSR